MRIKILLLSTVLLMAMKCQKGELENNVSPSETRLPAATQSGLNIYGCLVDGKPVIAGEGYRYTGATVYLDKMPDGFYKLTLFAEDRSSRSFPVKVVGTLGTKNITLPKIYIIPYGSMQLSIGPQRDYMARPSGNLNITRFDTVAKIISGTFDFHGENEWDTTQKINVTEGRFDFTYPFEQ